MGLLLIVVSLVIQIGSTEGTCRCLDQTLCGDSVSGCNYRCQPGFTGKNCQHDNLGYLSARNAKILFDGDYSTCFRFPLGTKMNFIQPIDVDTIRVHRKNNDLRKFYPIVYIKTSRVNLWESIEQVTAEGPAAASHFPVQTGVTAVRIDNMGIACEVELTNAKECRKGFYGNGCTQRCAAGCEDGDCNHVEGACVCKPGWMGGKCSEECSPGFYGTNCETPCNEGCQPQHCNHVTGDCNNRCRDGWKGRRCETECVSGRYGHYCRSECSEGCNSGTCDHASGRCSCKPGWRDDRCSQTCRKGFYGSGCEQRCAEGCEDGDCNHVDGSCVCKPGWISDKCSEKCSPGFYGANCATPCNEGCQPQHCHYVTGDCSYMCRDGWTGWRCERKCSQGFYGSRCTQSCAAGCKDGDCNHVNGSCVCKPGWIGDKCSEKCRRGRYGSQCQETCGPYCRTCHHVNGSCGHKCKSGWSGENCDKQCRKGSYVWRCNQSCAVGCEGGDCNHVNGSCVCTPGWIGDKCSERCSRTYYGSGCTHRCADGCVGRDCDHVDGSCMCKPGWMGDKCSENCPSGYYGPGCADSCSEGCYIGTCHHVSGNCSCKDGWTGEKCSEQCPSGYYGPGCADSCSEGCEGGTCHHVSGNCDCKDGWTGEKCLEPTIAGPTAPSSGYVERSDLDCSAGQMHVHIPLSLLPIHTVTLRDPTCKVTSNGTHLVADVGLNECGTTVSFTNNSVIFTNDIVATVRLAAGVTTSNIIDYGLNKDNQRVAISCVFPRENRIDFGYVPLQRKAHFYEKQYGNLIFEINQYQDEQFTRMLPHTGLPIGVTLNTEIFIDIAVDHNSNKGVGITVESCIATPTQSPADPVWYPLIKNGCPVQSDIRTFSSPDENEFRFSFLAFKFTRSPLQKIDPSLPASPMVYLHCQVSACPRQNCTSSCQGHSRSRREAESENAHLISAGPFYLKSEESQGYSGGIVAGTLSVACLTTLIALVAVVAWRRSVNKLSRYQNAQMTS